MKMRMLWLCLLVFVGTTVAADSCSGAATCPNTTLCSPTAEECLSSSPTTQCGGWGIYLTCGYEAQLGVITKECGSGKDADCQNTGACGQGTWEGIVCEYPELAPEGTATANWRCGTYGTRMSCQDYVPNGGALVGVCGSGSHEDCSGVCNGAHAVLCSKNENSMNWRACKWISGSNGEWVECPQGYVGAGHCGSGKLDDCGEGIWHELLCCPYEYPFSFSGYGLNIELRQDIFRATEIALNKIITTGLTAFVDHIPAISTTHAGVKDMNLSFKLTDGELFNSPMGFSYKYSVVNLTMSLVIDLKFIESCEWIISFTSNQEMPMIIPFEFDMTGKKIAFSSSPYWFSQTSKAIDFNLDCNSPLCNLNAICLASRGPLHRLSGAFDSAWNVLPIELGVVVKWPQLWIIYPLLLRWIFWEKVLGLILEDKPLLSKQLRPILLNLQFSKTWEDSFWFREKPLCTPPSSQAPRSSALSPPEQITIYLTDYFFHSLIWAIEASGALDVTLPPGAFPAGSPFQLNTGNFIQRSIAPGLRKYGSQPMVLVLSSTAYANVSQLEIKRNGITTSNNTLLFSYYIYNETTKDLGEFLYSVTQDFSAVLSIEIDDSGDQVVLEISISHLKCDGTDTIESNVGYVNDIIATSYTETAMLLVQQTLFAKPFVVPLPIPGKVFGGGGELVFTDDNYLIVGGDFFGGDFDFEV